MAWDKTKPAANTPLKVSNPEMLANNEAIETALDKDHDFTTGGTQTGKHDKVTLKEQSGDQTTASNEMALYTKDLGSAPGLYLRPESNGSVVQITGADAKILSASTDMLDEDNMASNSAAKTASQQSIKAYVDSGAVTMTNKTLTSPVINTSVSGNAVLDEDNMASNSATKLATQQSIKAYIDAKIAAIGSLFGAWSDKSTDTVYQAATDGFAMAYGHPDTGVYMYLYTDGNNPPTTERSKFRGNASTVYGSVFSPVKKGDYWKVTNADAVLWLPIGA